ncbi:MULTISPECIES: HigA family addiction module antitoxin [unclassified Halomonas]|uniref:HigA family addiction module antitoxin n=1 Tax=unclassified Halomonas TaxID=2609666 RepID=UPI0007D93F16|nr:MULTISPECIES: HigA family addiction module antitoxin [unclassified Halomonas]MBT2787117.1 HigA family addiction module antidote protein [Halomonas sp. ISL-106]MBT2795459.1 HigA family addiction module antidote protein [Halomonas sp. ISL-104]OAL57961.1 addiction module antidote protein, HigA family [Halomonas sp. ALS9]
MAMYNPSHPGRIIRQRLIEDEDGHKISSVASVAEQLGCHRNTLNRVINGSASVTPEMALALEKLDAGSAEFWLSMQTNYDLFQLRHNQGAA